MAKEKPVFVENIRGETLTDERLIPLYWVIMHNDPVTTMDFVVKVLMNIFGHGLGKAQDLMLEIHHTGSSPVALMPLERAEFKVEMVHQSARARGFPLTCTLEAD
ncbi:MAG: ATP-dependent Clp protease adaptor ClpS [Nitrospinota bacterium]|nr:ATP-dependent Clp protease adaptor ClpS [Nitrospinota bacterium]